MKYLQGVLSQAHFKPCKLSLLRERRRVGIESPPIGSFLDLNDGGKHGTVLQSLSSSRNDEL